IEDAVSENLLGARRVRLGVAEVGGQVCCHLLVERIGHSEAPPLLPALLDEGDPDGSSRSSAVTQLSSPPRRPPIHVLRAGAAPIPSCDEELEPKLASRSASALAPKPTEREEPHDRRCTRRDRRRAQRRSRLHNPRSSTRTGGRDASEDASRSGSSS